jgi:16S rRNA (guanine966-N2)-methyltransferase
VRIVAGLAKGVRLGPVPAGTRPVSDRAREGLFSSLGSDVRHARVLDLYAGTGALGIEALSRGADEAVFVDRSRGAADAVAGNLERSGLADRAVIHRAEVLAFLRREEPPSRSFDLVLLDPPYVVANDVVEAVLRELANGWLRSGGWTVVLTRPSGSSMPVIPVDWAARRQLRYGDSLLALFRED